MRKGHPVLLAYVVLAIILLQTAYVTLTGHQPVVFRNERGEVVTVRDLTTLFRVISASALVIGLLLLAAATRGYLGQRRDGQVHTKATLKVRHSLFKSGRIWIIFNVMLVTLSVWTGYAEMSPTRLDRTNPDIVLCIAVLVGALTLAIGTVHLAKVRHLRRPKWDRLPFNWWTDPLQALFVVTWCSLGCVIGSLFRVGGSGAIGIWTVVVFSSVFIGLLIGQVLAYRLYRNRIGDSEK